MKPIFFRIGCTYWAIWLGTANWGGRKGLPYYRKGLPYYMNLTRAKWIRVPYLIEIRWARNPAVGQDW